MTAGCTQSNDKSINENQIGANAEISRRKQKFHYHISAVFGNEFEFSESFLISEIDPQMIIGGLKHMLNLDSISKETVKYILREGARENNVLRLTEECFENMADSLGLPFEAEDKSHHDTLMDNRSHKSILKSGKNIELKEEKEDDEFKDFKET